MVGRYKSLSRDSYNGGTQWSGEMGLTPDSDGSIPFTSTNLGPPLLSCTRALIWVAVVAVRGLTPYGWRVQLPCDPPTYREYRPRRPKGLADSSARACGAKLPKRGLVTLRSDVRQSTEGRGTTHPGLRDKPLTFFL